MNYSEIEEWLCRKLQPVDGVLTDYVAIRQKAGQGYEQIARVKTDGKDPKDAAFLVVEAIKDAYASSDADGKSALKIQLKIYRAKEEDGSRIFSGGSVDVPDAGPVGREGELVATLRELRQLASETTAALARVSASGLQLAAQTLATNGELRAELAETKAALYLAENQQEPTKFANMLEAVLPMVLQKMSVHAPAPSLPVDAEGQR